MDGATPAGTQPPRLDDAFRIAQLTLACQAARAMLTLFATKDPGDAGLQMVINTILITERRYGSVDV